MSALTGRLGFSALGDFWLGAIFPLAAFVPHRSHIRAADASGGLAAAVASDGVAAAVSSLGITSAISSNGVRSSVAGSGVKSEVE